MKRNELRHILKDHFSLDEIIGITFDLGIDHESLPGMTKDAKARELIAACERRGLISDLEAHIHRQLPHLAWHSNGSVVVMMQNNSMPKLTQPSGFDPFGEPDCESDLELLGAAEYSHFYFANTRFSSEALDRKVYLIVGRRGSGKTALAHYFSFQRQILNAVAVDVDELLFFTGL